MQSLYDKLEKFLKKYYFNHFIKGSIYFGAFSLVLILSVLLLEYIGRFNGAVRAVFFYGAIASILVFLVYYVIFPLLKVYGLQKRIDFEQASKIIGSYFPEVSDRLLNTLQLHKKVSQNQKQDELLLASIEQRTKDLSPVPFNLAINFAENKKYLKYVVVPILMFSAIFFSTPEVITESSKRIVQYNQDFIPPEPYTIEVLTDKLEVRKGEDFKLKVGVKGDVVPQSLYVDLDGSSFKMKKNKNLHEFEFKKVQKTTFFDITAADISAKPFELRVIPNPSVVNFKIKANYPNYTLKSDEVVKNTGDLILPEGTEITWEVNTRDATELNVSIVDSLIESKRKSENTFTAKYQFIESATYELSLGYNEIKSLDTARFSVKVVPDAYPSIDVEETIDSTNEMLRFYQGFLKDDYGLTKCDFYYSVKDELGNEVYAKSENVSILKASLSSFTHIVNVKDLALKSGHSVSYYFEVFDNDGINGAKSTKTSVFSYKSPTKQELAEKANKSNENVQSELEAALNKAQDFQKEIDELQKKLIDKKKLDWNDKQQVKNLIEQQKSLKKQFDELRNENKKNLNEQEQFQGMSEELLEKQQELDELMDKLMTEEMKEMLEKMEEMLDELDKNKLQKELEKMELSNEDLEKELDRSLEMFKRLDFETKLQQNIEKAKELAKKQEELAEKTESGEESNEELAKEQEELEKETKELKKDLEEMKEKNEALEKPEDLPNEEEKAEEAQQQMQESKESLEQNRSKQSKQNQKKAQEKLEQISQSLSMIQQQMQEEKQYEDMEDLRALLENIVQLSFDEEELVEATKTLKRNDPRYVKITQEQKNIQENAQVVEDSLLALSKRIAQIEPTINKEMNRVKKSMEESVKALADRNKGLAASKEQYAMTSLNNLALLLDEILQQMQQEMNSMMQAQGSCSKPGSNSKPSMGDLKKMQQQLNEQMKKLQQQMQGKQQGGKKQGEQQGLGIPGMSKQIAKMAAKQAAIKEYLRKLEEQISNGQGKQNSTEPLKKIQELMNQTEEDLVNWQITKQTLKRQEEIITRLLESEKAEREQEEDKKRESTEVKEKYNLTDELVKQYQLKKQKEIELIRTLPTELSEFYRNKVSEYMKE